MRKHIELYVNDYSDDVGEEGIAAVHELFARARSAGILDADCDAALFSLASQHCLQSPTPARFRLRISLLVTKSFSRRPGAS